MEDADDDDEDDDDVMEEVEEEEEEEEEEEAAQPWKGLATLPVRDGRMLVSIIIISIEILLS